MFTHRHGADCAFAKVFSFYAERVVKTSTVVFPCNRRSQLNKLRLVESLPESRKQCIGDFYGGERHRVGVFEHQTLQFGEVPITPMVRQVGNLLGGNSVCPAHGRANIDSKRTSDKSRNAKLRETFDLVIDELAPQLRLLHLPVTPQDFRVMSAHLNRHDHMTDLAAGQAIYESDEEAAKDAA